jgi:hypothetical protein
LALLFFDIVSMLPLPVLPPWRADLAVELDRDARVAPVAGAVLIFLPVRCPLPGEALGAAVVAVGAGVSELLLEARCAADLDLPWEAGVVWAEAVVMLAARAARMRSFFMKKEVEMRTGITEAYGNSAPSVGLNIYGSA